MNLLSVLGVLVSLYHRFPKKQPPYEIRKEKSVSGNSAKKFWMLPAVFCGVWLILRFLLPLVFPFLLGAALALLAEPAVAFLHRKLGIKRGFASALGVLCAIVLLISLFLLLISLMVKELGILAGALPDMESTLLGWMTGMQDLLLSITDLTPDGIRPLLNRSVLNLFSSGTNLLEQAVQKLPTLLSGLLAYLSNGILGIGTGLLSAFMISARLPELKDRIARKLPARWRKKLLPTLRCLRQSIFGWLKAQVRLSALTWCIVTAGLLFLRIPFAPLWALLIALVDAIPVLGTGTILIPWALAKLLQRATSDAVILAATYAASVLSRSLLEPRMVGKQLGLDPLMTLIALYAGYRIWGIGGIILAPLLAVTATELAGQSE